MYHKVATHVIFLYFWFFFFKRLVEELEVSTKILQSFPTCFSKLAGF